MKVSVYLKTRDGSCEANAIFEGEKITVLKGSKVRKAFAEHIRGGKTAKLLRNDTGVVNESGIVLKDCVFSSPSTAAQFVMGSSVNGWIAWHVDKKTNLKDYLAKQ